MANDKDASTDNDSLISTSNDGTALKSSKTSSGFASHAFRYLGLFFICLMTTGSYYVYDIPAALQSPIEKFYHVNDFQWNLLYSVYSFPNMIIVFFGGYFIDNVFGVKKGAIIFCCLIMTGQVIFAFSSNVKLFWLALVGRTVFGLGGESLGVAQSTFCALWFKGRSDINFAFAITLAFSRIGSAINFNISPAVEAAANLPTAIWVGAIICAASFGGSIILVALDVIRGKKDKDEPIQAVGSFMDIIKSFKDVFHFPGTLWLINLSVVLFYVPLFVYVSISGNFYRSKYGIDPYNPESSSSTTAAPLAGDISSVPYYAATASPLIGLAVDYFGHNIYFTLTSSVLLVLAHGLFSFTTITPWAGSFILGASYAFMAASIWVTIPCLVPTKSLGTAYGLAFACQNAAIAISGIVVNAIITALSTNPTTYPYASPNAYRAVELIFFGCACLCFVIQVVIIIVDRKNKWINIPSADMKQRVKDINHSDGEKVQLIN